MSYRIAGIDVHKRMLTIVVSDVEVVGEFAFERRQFGSGPAQLRKLAGWLVRARASGGGGGVGGGGGGGRSRDGMGGAILETCVGQPGTRLEAARPAVGRRRPDGGHPPSGAGAIESRAAGAQAGLH